MTGDLLIREAKRNEQRMLGEFMVEVYSNIEAFPAPAELPDYCEMLANVESLNAEKDFKVLVAESTNEQIARVNRIWCCNRINATALGCSGKTMPPRPSTVPH